MFRISKQLYFSPPDNPESGVIEADPKDLSLLDDDGVVEDKEETVKVESDEDGPEVKEEDKEDEVKETTEEEIEPEGVYTRPGMKELKEKYPTLLKDFPQIKHALFIAQRYSEEFPTLADVTEAKEKSETFDQIQSDIDNGRVDSFLTAIRDYNPKIAENFVESFLPKLFSVDQGLYYKAITPIVEQAIRSMAIAGKKKGDDNLYNSALYALQHFQFDESILEGKSSRPEVNTEIQNRERQIAQRESQFEVNRFNEVVGRIDSELADSFEKEIGLLVDKEKGTDYEKKSMKKDILSEVNKMIGSDAAHNKHIASLWERSKKAGYNREWQDRIKQAWLSRARSILPQARAKVRKEMFGGKVVEKVVNKATKVPTQQLKAPPNGSPSRVRMKSDFDILNEP